MRERKVSEYRRVPATLVGVGLRERIAATDAHEKHFTRYTEPHVGHAFPTFADKKLPAVRLSSSIASGHHDDA